MNYPHLLFHLYPINGGAYPAGGFYAKAYNKKDLREQVSYFQIKTVKSFPENGKAIPVFVFD